MSALDSTPSFKLGCYDKTKIYGAPPSPNYSNIYNAPSQANVVILTTAGTWNGHEVIGVVFEDTGLYGASQPFPMTDPGGGTNPNFDSKFDDATSPVNYALICSDGYAVNFTTLAGVYTTGIEGYGAAVGPNHARRRILGYI